MTARSLLTVMTDNPRGIALYRRQGFDVEGTRRRSLVVDGAPVDAMAKLLEESGA